MTIIDDFKALQIDKMGETYRLICDAYDEAKRARLVALEAEIRQLGFSPGERRKAPANVKYRLSDGTGWSGRGALPTAFKKAGVTKENIEQYRVKEKAPAGA